MLYVRSLTREYFCKSDNVIVIKLQNLKFPINYNEVRKIFPLSELICTRNYFSDSTKLCGDKKFRENLEAVVQRCSIKKLFLETSQYPQENNCARVSFLIKLQA